MKKKSRKRVCVWCFVALTMKVFNGVFRFFFVPFFFCFLSPRLSAGAPRGGRKGAWPSFIFGQNGSRGCSSGRRNKKSREFVFRYFVALTMKVRPKKNPKTQKKTKKTRGRGRGAWPGAGGKCGRWRWKIKAPEVAASA